MGGTSLNWWRTMDNQGRGKVYLVGAGPGDPKLITVRGLELLSRAEVIVNDRLASPRLLKHVRPDAEIVYAGKASRDHKLTQDEIIEVIIDRALKGKTVVRLKGGDPFVFGRGGEEAIALREAGIEFEVVPGVTSAVAAPAYAGIPVTHRHEAVSLGIITGHEAAGKVGSEVRWEKIATGLDTLVFLMGVENLPAIVERLIENGRSADTPVALVRWGTHPSQQTLTGTLADIVRKVEETRFTAPAVTVVGNVVKLRDAISWFENRPLFGKRIIVTRAEHQASALTQPLEELGARVDEFPVIRFAPVADDSVVRDAISRLPEFDWILFTSANGVEWFVKHLLESDRDIRAMGNAKLGAIGPKTAAAVRELKLAVDFVPSTYVAESVMEGFPEDPTGKRILIPRALEAREELPEGLRGRGAEVCVAPVYETVVDDSGEHDLRQALEEGVDIITFTSASTVHSFFELIGDMVVPASVIIACIGPITAEAAQSRGLTPAVISQEYTIEGLVKSIARFASPSQEA